MRFSKKSEYALRALIELHRGRFVLASEPGIGTTVTFSLPPDRIAA